MISKMKKSIVLVIVAVISVSAAIFRCSNSKADSSYYHNNSVLYEDKNIKVYTVSIGNGYYVVAFSKRSGDIDICR